jgi:hypothetical protein
MDMVNLEKISELLEKGVDNPSFQSDEGKFSAEKWKKEVQEHTEPFLRVITERLNEALTEEKDFWQGNKFKILKKRQGKQHKISSLQDSKCKLPEPFAIEVSDNDRRPVEGFIGIGPSASLVGEDYTSSVCWGLRWWGTAQKAQTVYEIFKSLNVDGKLTDSVFNDNFGTFVWLFNSMNNEKLARTGIESIADIVTKDFLKLSSILSKKKELFRPHPPIMPEKHPTRGDVEKAIRRIWSSTGQTRINKSDVLETIESDLKKKGVTLKSDWRSIIEGRLEHWFG